MLNISLVYFFLHATRSIKHRTYVHGELAVASALTAANRAM